MTSLRRWTAADVPDQSGRTAVVTGASAGIGLETARVLAGHGATVVLACRDVGKAGQAADRIRAWAGSGASAASVRVVHLDLANLASVREAASEIRASCPRLDLLINNAGVKFEAGTGADQPSPADAELPDRAERADGRAANAAGGSRRVRPWRRVLRPAGPVRHRLPGPGGVERPIARHGSAAAALGSFRATDRGGLPHPCAIR